MGRVNGCERGGRGGRQWEYRLQLREKQKAKRYYGVLEKQFRRYFDRALAEPGHPGTNLLVRLERRLDNVVYRLGFGTTRAQARQFVTHGHVQVNGAKVDRPSFAVRPGDVITFKPGSAVEPVCGGRRSWAARFGAGCSPITTISKDEWSACRTARTSTLP
jgi:small subunit ribosomal protein S4